MKEDIYIPIDVPQFIIKIKNKQCAAEVLEAINIIIENIVIIENTVKGNNGTLLAYKYEAIKATLLDVINDNIY